ncbi:putative oxidoreductase GLYR1 [Aplysia californica]|uniref:Cytokine-like nuclear factor N-PAC n=1 Tax=Aplysia californica TaxID=6500 RepID=A0ABM0JL23_APLCA|nr:putative oxidoreductase GLYR1 [Aplysia californica]
MASNFKIGDLVWAKMKGFQAWPGKIVEPKENIKKPANKKNVQFVYFYGSENYAWIQEENIYLYPEYKSKYEGSSRIPRGFKEALEAIENEHQAMLASGKLEDLPSIDEEVALMQKSAGVEGDASASTPAPRKIKKQKDSKDGKESQTRKSKLMSPMRKGGMKRPSGSSLDSGASSSAKKFFMSKSGKSSDLDISMRGGDDSMRDSYHFTHTLGTGDMGVAAKLEDIDEVMSEEKVASKTVIPTPLRIGFLGLGIMGQGMVMNLLRSGHEVTVWNRTATKCREFVKAGALKGNNPADVVQSCDITFTCVADSTAVRDIMFGNMGVLDGISKGKCYVEMSTVDEETVQDVADAIMARGGAFLEAPVCGSRVPALEGQLLILCSGDRKLFDDCYSCFEAMGKRSFYLGNEVGTATRMKLINNMILGNVVASLAEGMALAEKLGIDMEDFAEVLSLGSLSCRSINHKSQAILNGRFDPHFPLQHQQKDLRLVLGLGDSVEQPLHLAAAANELFKKARRMGYGEGDVAAVFKAANEFGADGGDATGLNESSSK